ncbi:YbaB/EbfC family nucleoid-associated protein [Allokutzneria oryzae]|uniref:YbaB/EbfC family nucleoid-associated protein n=1 Tax=Allokutzneria oryzae TaxID=1378989 RepID=A0ABV6A786_9PSEU
MSTPYDDEIEALLARYEQQRHDAVDCHRRMREVSVTVTAPKRALTVTVGPQGELTNVDFPTGAYRTMAPKELAALLMKTVATAREQALESVAEVLAGVFPGGLDVAGLHAGRAGVEDLLPERPPMPAFVKDALNGGGALS